MKETLSDQIDRLEKSFDNIEREAPFLKSAVKAFRGVMISRAALKARLPERSDIHISPPEDSRFSEGIPWLTEQTITSFVDPWGDSVKSTIQPLLKAFPSIRLEISRTQEAFERGSIDLKYCIGALVEGREEDIVMIANRLGFNPIVLKFILGQILKPFVEKRAEELQPLIKDVPWQRGYCPICGSFPELSFLQGDEGQRWLKCSLCGYDWRFDRMTCPYCEEKNENKELICVVGSEHKWLELCHECHRYIVGIDLRKQGGIITDVAAIGMIHLDIIAQQKGFLPTAECAWNMVPPSN